LALVLDVVMSAAPVLASALEVVAWAAPKIG
jgi:hypothetical protein